MRHRNFPTLAWLVFFVLVGCQGGRDNLENSGGQEGRQQLTELEGLQASLPVRPGVNVIVVSFDALRADALGTYGHPRRTSPRIDAFAAESIVFENAYTVAPVTPTSFASAFTGMLPTRVFHAWNLASDDTLAQRFSDAGYTTAAFINNAQLTPERSFDAGFELYDFFSSRRDRAVLKSSLAWLGDHRDGRLFVWIHFLSPHAPYEYRELAAHLYDPSYEGEFEKTTKGVFDTDDPTDVARIKSLYEGEVFFADTLFGELLDGLRETGHLESSIVVLTSDHGEEFKEHGRFQHDRLTEEHVRVPLIVRHPEPRPLRSEILVSNVDFLPTFLSLAGIAPEGHFDGRDWTRISQDPDWIAGVSMTSGKERWLSLRRGDHKLIQTCLPDTRRRLFDLAADPGEHDDLHDQEPALVRKLFRELEVLLGGPPCTVMQAAVQGAEPTVGLSEENIEALKALGYLSD